MKVVWKANNTESGLAKKLNPYSFFLLQDWEWLDKKLEAHFQKNNAGATNHLNEGLKTS